MSEELSVIQTVPVPTDFGNTGATALIDERTGKLYTRTLGNQVIEITSSANASFVQSGSGPVDLSNFTNVQTALDGLNNGLGTAALFPIGTSGAVVGLLTGSNTWDGAQVFSVPPVFLDAAGTAAAMNAAVTNAVNTFDAASQEIRFTDTGAAGPTLKLRLNTSSPAASDVCGTLSFNAKDDAGNLQEYAHILVSLLDPTSGSEDGQFVFRTWVAGTSATRATLFQGLTMAGATGGDKGAGSINAQAVYDDNVLLTDYVFDLHIDGKLQESDEGTAKAEAFDPRLLDLDFFWEQTAARRALPAMPTRAEWREETRPSIGDLAQRLWEMVEVQAVHIEKLNQRIKALEAK